MEYNNNFNIKNPTYFKEYYQTRNNNGKIQCECGMNIYYSNKFRHTRTNKHLKLMMMNI